MVGVNQVKEIADGFFNRGQKSETASENTSVFYIIFLRMHF